jgi:hypothetical protein
MLSAAMGRFRALRFGLVALVSVLSLTFAASTILAFQVAGGRLIPENVGYQSVLAASNNPGITLGSVTLQSGGGHGSPYDFFFATPATVGPWHVSGSGVTHARALNTTSAVLWVNNLDPQGENGFYNGFFSGP